MNSSFEAFRHFFNSSPHATALVSSEGTVLAINSEFLELLSLPEKVVLDKHLSSSCLQDGASQLPVPLNHAWSGIVVCTTGQGVKKYNAKVRPLAESEQEAAPYVALELFQIEQASEDAFQQQKLESLGVLASSVAHDLNNILTGVLGHVSYLRLSLPQTVSHRESVGAIEDGSRRAAALTQQILEFAKGEEVELCTVNFSLVVAAGLNILRGSIPENIVLSFKGDREDIFVYGDESQLSQLVMNLVVNAKDALRAGGFVKVTLSKVASAPESVLSKFPDLPKSTYTVLSVSDDGEGIPESIRDKIFEPFFTTKEKNGTGIGLATVHSIVRAHRGAIEVDSIEGQGTTFTVYLPISSAELEQEEESPQTVSREDSDVPTGSESILVVDDEETVRTVMQRSLEHLGYKVATAANGAEGLELYKKNPADYSLVILDMIMPKMTGDELFYKLLEVNPNTPVLIASGYSSDARTKEVLRDGALGFIQKPFAVEELAIEVRRCLDLAKS